jgi:hypothetical protein
MEFTSFVREMICVAHVAFSSPRRGAVERMVARLSIDRRPVYNGDRTNTVSAV